MSKEPNKADPLARLVDRRAIDLVVIVDCELSNRQILEAFAGRGLDFSTLEIPHPKVRYFRRASALELTPVSDDERFQFVRLIVAGFEEILIGATHLYDRHNYPLPQSRRARASRHRQTLIDAELFVEHERTLLLGDFNMTPEEEGMVDALSSFGALMSWDLAEAHSPPPAEGPPRFFNPMWSLMGRAEAPGTYYWDSTDHLNIYWQCLDGVIARHGLRGVFLEDTLRIITTIPGLDDREVALFHRAEKQWRVDFSDHLPIQFELQLKPNPAGVTS